MSEEEIDDGDSSSALALALLSASWRASFFGDDEDPSSSSPFALGAPPALRSWAFAATICAIQERENWRRGTGSNGSKSSWPLAAARLSLLTLSPPTELAALVSGAAASSSSSTSSSTFVEVVVAETVSRALRRRCGEGGEEDGYVAAVAAAAAAVATTDKSYKGVVPPLSRFLRASLRNGSSSFPHATATVATALGEILANGAGGGNDETESSSSSLSCLATSLADAVSSFSESPSSSSPSSHSLLASLCRLRARLALSGVVACGRGEEDDEGGDEDNTCQTKESSQSLAPLWATMLSPPPPLSRLAAKTAAAKPPLRNLLRPLSDQALAAAAACVAALPGSPLRPWKDGEVDGGGGDAELALAAAVPLRDSAHPACRVAAAAACWLKSSLGTSSSPSLRAALGDVVLSAASFVGEEGARKAMVDAVVAVASSEKRSRLPSSSYLSPSSSILVAARAAITAAANRARDGSELAPTIVTVALVARSGEDFEFCLEGLVGSGAADSDAGELVSDALSEAWPCVSKLIETAEGGRDEDAGVDMLCRLLLARVPDTAAKVAAFVGLVSRLSGSGKGERKDLSDARPPPPLAPSLTLERIVLRTLEEDSRRRGSESDAALASAAKLGVKLLLLLHEEEGAKTAAAKGKLARSLLPRIVQRACELFAERGGGGNSSSPSPATSTLCGELAARAAAAASRKKGEGAFPSSLPWRSRLSAPSLLLLPGELPPSLLAQSSDGTSCCSSSSSALSVASDLCALAWGSAEGEEAVVRAAAGGGEDGNTSEAEPAADASLLLLSRLRSFGIRASHSAIEAELVRAIPALSLAESERLTLRALPEMLRATTTAAATAKADAASLSPLASLPRSAFRALSIEMLCRVAAAAEFPSETSSSLTRAALRAATAAARSGPPALARRALAEAATLVAGLKRKGEHGAAAVAASVAIPSLLQMISHVLGAVEKTGAKQRQRQTREEVVAWVRAAVVAVADDEQGTLAGALRHEGRW